MPTCQCPGGFQNYWNGRAVLANPVLASETGSRLAVLSIGRTPNKLRSAKNRNVCFNSRSPLLPAASNEFGSLDRLRAGHVASVKEDSTSITPGRMWRFCLERWMAITREERWPHFSDVAKERKGGGGDVGSITSLLFPFFCFRFLRIPIMKWRVWGKLDER